tara:strand:- start:411 stop:608 length:198 start_codon:yes stop_codon:yes gene_type:complete
MLSLETKYESYLGSDKKLRIDGIEESVSGYGWNCDGNNIVGYWVTTKNYKLYYNMKEEFLKMEKH